MNAPRIALERTAAAMALGRSALTARASARSCRPLVRPFSLAPPRWSTSEKVETTSSAPSYQPYPLARPPPAPRDTDVTESSIAMPVPAPHETRRPLPPHQQQQHPSSTAPTAGGAAATANPSPQPAAPAATAAAPETETPTKPQPSAAPPRKRKLRPLKAAMKLTPTAVAQLRELLDGPDPKLIRVGVRNRGCSGLAYHLEYVDKPGAFDEAVEQDGVKVLIDSKALFSIIGSEMDWVEDKLNQRFVFRNPNISTPTPPSPPKNILYNPKSSTFPWPPLANPLLTPGHRMLTKLQRKNAAAESHSWCNMESTHICIEA